MRRSLVAALVLGGCVIGGCSAFGVGESDPPPAPPPQTNPPIDSGGIPIAPDAAAPVDAGSAAEGASDAATEAGRFCQPSMFLCADFDGPNLGDWSKVVNVVDERSTTGGSLDQGPTYGNDSSGLRSFIPKNTTGRYLRSFTHEGLADVLVEVDVLVERPAASLSTQPLRILKAGYGKEDTIEFYVEAVIRGVDLGVNLLVQAQGLDYGMTPGATVSELIPYGVWTRLALHAGVVTTNGGSSDAIARVSYTNASGAVVRDVAGLKRGDNTFVTPRRTSTVVGVHRSASDTPVDFVVRIDNVVTTLKP